jgi:hypothetical protein
VKEKILFFSRMRLTEQYGELNKHLINDFECLHVPYDNFEENILLTKYNLPSKYNMQSYLKNNLYSPSLTELKELDLLILKYTNNRFNLNSSIQFDRGLKLLNLDDAYSIAYTYFIFWDNIFKKENVSYMFHETTSLFFNFIASVLSIKYDVIYSDMIKLPSNNNGFMFLSSSNAESLEFNRYYTTNIIDNTSVTKFSEFIENKYKSIAPLNLNKSLFKTFILVLKNELAIIKNKITKSKDIIYNNIDYYILFHRKELKRFINLIAYKFIKWDTIKDEEFYFYPMHLEPEAVVQYWADGIYENQIKLLENIASQLPVGCYLYVKDHVIDYGYRNYSDYLKLKKIPNIKLIDPTIRGTVLIKKAKAVITINGTAGLEAMFFKKVVYSFGNIFYNKSKNVTYINNIKDLRAELYSDKEFDAEDYKIFITSYIKSLYEGDTSWFTGAGTKIDDNVNIENIANSIKNFIKSINTDVV